jgi:hypothetical protein
MFKMETVAIYQSGIQLPKAAVEALGKPHRVLVLLFQKHIYITVSSHHRLTNDGRIQIKEGDLHFKRGHFSWEMDSKYGTNMLVILNAGARFQPEPLPLAYRKRPTKNDVPRLPPAQQTRSPT